MVEPSDDWDPAPPNDCRLTARCFRECFGFKIEPPYDYEPYRRENSVIDTFFERRRDDASGGEDGDRIAQVRSRPVFSLHVGRMRGATLFDITRPPQAVVWLLLGAEQHDERHKGRGDAYDLFARQERDGVLFPRPVDYQLVELSRRQLDTSGFGEGARRDAENLIRTATQNGRAEQTLAGIPARAALIETDETMTILVVAISNAEVRGPRSGLMFPLTEERFYLVAASVQRAASGLADGEIMIDIPTYEFPGGLRNERAFQLGFATDATA